MPLPDARDLARRHVMKLIRENKLDDLLFHGTDLDSALGIELEGLRKGGLGDMGIAQDYAWPPEKGAFAVFRKQDLPKNLRKGVNQFFAGAEADLYPDDPDLWPYGTPELVDEAPKPHAVLSRKEAFTMRRRYTKMLKKAKKLAKLTGKMSPLLALASLAPLLLGDDG